MIEQEPKVRTQFYHDTSTYEYDWCCDRRASWVRLITKCPQSQRLDQALFCWQRRDEPELTLFVSVTSPAAEV